MTWIAFILLLVSVFMHAGWNLMSRNGGHPSASFYLLMSLTAAIVWTPFLVFARPAWGSLPWHFWCCWIGSGIFEVVYCLGLFKAYSKCDISLAYPMVRAMPVLVVAAITLCFGLGKIPGMVALLGMVVVSLGCLLMPLHTLIDFKLKNYFNPAIGAIAFAAMGTAGYTVLDSVALKEFRGCIDHSNIVSCMAYLTSIEWMISIGLGLYVWLHPREHVEFRRLFLRSARPSIAGCCSSSCYGMVLLAMGYVTNVSYIQAFRQMSLPIGVLAGIFILKEKCPLPKLIGIILVVTGLVMVALN